jgi:hypothetical protein
MAPEHKDTLSVLDAAGLRSALDELKRAAGVTDRHATRRRRARERAAAVTTTNGSGG